MSSAPPVADARVAVLVDCDNTRPEILDHALRVVAQFGRTVLRRGYGNTQTLSGKWQEALVGQAFTPCLQYQYAAGKNTADIALALDATSDQFFEWVPPEPPPTTPDADTPKAAPVAKAVTKRRPKSVIRAVELLLADMPDGRVGLGQLGQYLRRTDPAFSPQAYGHSALAEMIRTYPDLTLEWEESKGYWVGVKMKGEGEG